jgi:hypothetical protein
MAENFDSLRAIVPHVQQLKKDPHARVGYDLFADALVWSDERPSVPRDGTEPIDVSSLRAVLHYRTSIILGNPNERYASVWEEAMRLFPGWPGFSLDRRQAAFRDTYLKLREEAYRNLREVESRFEK